MRMYRRRKKVSKMQTSEERILDQIQKGDKVGYLFKNYLTGQEEKVYGIVHSIGPRSTSQPEMRVSIKRVGKRAKAYAGTVTSIDPSSIVERARAGEPTVLFN
jgi:hypothetical protein